MKKKFISFIVVALVLILVSPIIAKEISATFSGNDLLPESSQETENNEINKADNKQTPVDEASKNDVVEDDEKDSPVEANKDDNNNDDKSNVNNGNSSNIDSSNSNSGKSNTKGNNSSNNNKSNSSTSGKNQSSSNKGSSEQKVPNSNSTRGHVEKGLLAGTTYIDTDGKVIVKNPDDLLVLVNKYRNLPADYKPKDLVIPNVRFAFQGMDEKKYMRKEAAKALEELFKAAEEEGIYLYAVSGFRSYGRQKFLFEYRAARNGFEEANKLTAYPGQSEHQTGLAMDINCKAYGTDLKESFSQTPEGIWIKNNAHRFGFILRYPKGTEHITCYSYEPWHIRYVGRQVANEIYERGITFEEYMGF
jgi:LAS superfamily LD-carboxypeptidase LdcB